MKKKADPPRQKGKPSALHPGRRHPAGQFPETETPAIVDEVGLLSDLRSLIQTARQRIATVANATTTLLYWHLGRRLLAENLQDERAQYGKRILATVSQELTIEFGQTFTLRSLYRAIQFCQSFTDEEIVSTLSTQLSWSHFIELLPIKDPLARDFYAEMCRIERWDVRTLRQKIGGMLFQRTALSRRPEAVISAEIAKLGRCAHDLQRWAAKEYKPVVDHTLRNCGQDILAVEREAEGLLNQMRDLQALAPAHPGRDTGRGEVSGGVVGRDHRLMNSVASDARDSRDASDKRRRRACLWSLVSLGSFDMRA